MAREPSQKLVDYGIIAGVLLAGYFVWTAFFKKEAPKECPPGQHAVNPCEGQMGWPAFLCNLGRNVTGAFLDCKPDVPGGGLPCADIGGAKCKSEGGIWKDAPDCTCTGSTPPGNLDCGCTPGKKEDCVFVKGGKWIECEQDRKTPACRCEVPLPVVLPKDEHGCIIGVQHYCDLPDLKCRDIAQKCTPAAGKPGTCYEWDVLSGRWIYSPSLPDCGIITCPDGSQHYKENCPVKIDPCPVSECTPGSIICASGIPKVCVEGGIECRDHGVWSIGGNACKPVSNIVDCRCGKVDLNNPPGTTCETACKGYSPLGACKVPMFDAMRGCGQTDPGKSWGGSRAECQFGGDLCFLNSQGLWVNEAQDNYNRCLANTCGWEWLGKPAPVIIPVVSGEW